MASEGKGKKQKSSGNSRSKILSVALKEFAQKGLAGARVDQIADRAKTSKNMIYYHFQSKDGLYREVMKSAYISHRQAERNANVDLEDPVGALKRIITRSFDYLCKNEMFVRLVMSENMNHAKSIKDFDDLKQGNQEIIETLRRILDAGKRRKLFRDKIEPVELHLTISALGFHYVSNRYTFASLFDIDMKSEQACAQRRDEVVDIVLRWCCTNPEQQIGSRRSEGGDANPS